MNNKKQRNRLFTMLLLVMAILMPYGGAWAQTASQPSEGDGKTGNPYIITKAEELAWFRDQVNSGNNFICAKISEDVEVIDMSTVCHAEDKSQNLEELSWEPIGKNDYGYQYWGTFDGNGKTITNLYINASQKNVGLFGYTSEGTIKNLTFEYANVTNTGVFTGILVGYATGYGNASNLRNIKISNTCQIKGGKETGGIAGDLSYANAYNCVNYATVQGNNRVGGLFGYCSVENSSITTCANYGNVTATSTDAGGLVGYFASGTIQDCANYGDVKGTERVAGMAGYVYEGKIQNVFSYGNVSATNRTQDIGMAFGNSDNGTTEGMVAYYSGAKLNANGQEITIKAFGNGKPSEDNATGFTEAQLRSGEVAWLLNGSTSTPAEGNTLAWYQKLGEKGDKYPVLKSTGDNTVYGGYQHGSKDGCFSNTVIANQHSVAYNAEAEDEANGNHDLSYEAGEYTWTEAEDKTQVPSVAVTYTCKVCGKTEKPQMTVAHDEEHDNVEATCTEDGHKYYKTSYAFNAKAIFSNAYTQTFPALGHNMSEDVTFNDSKSIYQKGCTRTDCDYHDYYATSDGSIEAKPNDDASAFTVEAFTLNDATVYNSKAKFTVKELTYNRSFAHDKWQALYVPFETEVTEELLKDFELAAPNNLHEYELADGSTKISLEAKLMKSGYTIKAQRPYLIRAKEAGEKTIQLTDCSLKAAAEDSYVDCSSVLRHYKFIGTLKGKTSFDTSADFVLQQGVFLGTETDTQLKPMRWYLNATDRDTDMGILPGSGNNGVGGGADGGNGSTQASRSINITIVDGDATTGIDDLHVITEQASGSKNGARLGIYDLQGRKLSQEPQNGVYIKDGKKVIK